jgi:hypothetical protein
MQSPPDRYQFKFDGTSLELNVGFGAAGYELR